MSKQAILYARLALANGDRLQNQLDDCRTYAERHGYTVVGEFADNGVSGLLPMLDRKQGCNVLKVLERGEVQAIIVTTADRLSRDFAHWKELVQQLQQAGIELHYVEPGQDV